MSMLPLLLIGVLFGLAMDYQVFLVTRMREEHVHGAEPHEAMVTGFRHGARVVVAAAIIMISVFAGFVLAEATLIQSIGFALAFGVAVDAFVVRMTIVPAVMSLLRNRAWWLPKLLDRVLPNVDVEGTRLTEKLDSDSACCSRLKLAWATGQATRSRRRWPAAPRRR
jgi:RND superfamily putative drug exporter